MLPRELKNHLESVLDEFEPDRDYLGMSSISRCPLYLYTTMLDGRRVPNLQGLRYCHEGYVHEADVIARLVKAGLAVVNCNREIVAPFDERFRGHVDGELILSTDRPVLIEVKSVNDERYEQVVQERQLPTEHYDQVQCYLRFGGYRQAFVIYKARQTGEIWVMDVAPDPERGEALEHKAREILAAVDARTPPRCECGRCR